MSSGRSARSRFRSRTVDRQVGVPARCGFAGVGAAGDAVEGDAAGDVAAAGFASGGMLAEVERDGGGGLQFAALGSVAEVVS